MNDSFRRQPSHVAPKVTQHHANSLGATAPLDDITPSAKDAAPTPDTRAGK
jgi:hypothetical protein